MPALRLRFLSDQLRATAWDEKGNQGPVEWPPGSWRLLRAFVVCGFSTQGWSEVPSTAARLINKLAASLPWYRLPAASTARGGHCTPLIEGGTQTTPLAFNTWANTGGGEVLIHWPCELDVEELELLGQLAATLGYVDRSEDRMDGPFDDNHSAAWNVVPCLEDERRGPGWRQVSLMAAISPASFGEWRSAGIQRPPFSVQGQKRTAAAEGEPMESTELYPPDLIACLAKDIAWWKDRGWPQPPGSQRVLYWRPSESPPIRIPEQRRTSHHAPVSTILLSLATPGENRRELPPVSQTLPLAELLHRAIVARAGRGRPVQCPELTGKDDRGYPLCDHHGHVHTIPLDLDGDNRLDHLLLYARMKIADAAQQAISGLRRVWAQGGAVNLRPALLVCGDLSMLRQLPPPLECRIANILGPVGGACVWKSIAPFVPPRFLKARGKNCLLGQVNAELASRNLPEAEHCEIVDSLTESFCHFVRRRRRSAVAPPLDIGYGLRLTFNTPVAGPLLLGYASHFGLGLFAACDG